MSDEPHWSADAVPPGKPVSLETALLMQSIDSLRELAAKQVQGLASLASTVALLSEENKLLGRKVAALEDKSVLRERLRDIVGRLDRIEG